MIKKHSGYLVAILFSLTIGLVFCTSITMMSGEARAEAATIPKAYRGKWQETNYMKKDYMTYSKHHTNRKTHTRVILRKNSFTLYLQPNISLGDKRYFKYYVSKKNLAVSKEHGHYFIFNKKASVIGVMVKRLRHNKKAALKDISLADTYSWAYFYRY